MTLESIAERVDKTITEFIQWTETLNPDHIYFFRDDNEDVLCCVYTDGDSGIILFTGDSEIFKDHGCTICNLESKWCDIDYESMGNIIINLNPGLKPDAIWGPLRPL